MTALRNITSPVILLLAAGEGSRFGGAKQLADVGGEPMVRRVARILLDTDMPVIAVTGAYADDVEAVLDDLPLQMARCEDWQLGMGNSLATGTQELLHNYPHASAVLICLADQPMLDKASILAMLRWHQNAADRLLVTEYQGIQGPPALFPHDCFDVLKTLSGKQGARAVLEQHATRVDILPLGINIDVDTVEDLRQVQVLLASSSLL
jgi:molybdenum cofactor cytidylyltransferase